MANACATGATALRTAIMAIKAGECDMGLAVGVEKLSGAGLLGAGGGAPEERQAGLRAERPLRRRHQHRRSHRHQTHAGHVRPDRHGVRPQVRRHVSFELFAKISEKNHSHSTLNPLAAYTKKMTLEEIMGDMMIAYPNTRPMCSANCDGAAAAVVVSGAKLKTLSHGAAEAGRQGVGVDPHQRPVAGGLPGAARRQHAHPKSAAKQAYEQAGVGPEDLDLVELHDCFATAELVHYDNLQLCEEGGAVDFFNSGAPWRDGKTPVNVSGGLQSKGHPIAATGIANIWEVCHHLRGEAGDRQIEGAKVGLAHVIGLGSACGVHILEKSAA